MPNNLQDNKTPLMHVRRDIGRTGPDLAGLSEHVDFLENEGELPARLQKFMK